jgi:hypothetical protein
MSLCGSGTTRTTAAKAFSARRYLHLTDAAHAFHLFLRYPSRRANRQQPLRSIGFDRTHRHKRLALWRRPPLTELRLLTSEFYRCRVRCQFSLGIAPGKSSHPRPSFCTVVGNRIEPTCLVTRDPNDRLLQAQLAQNPRWNRLTAFIRKQTKDFVAPAMRCLERILRMSGEVFAVFLFVARDCHLIAAWQNADISKLAICSLPFLHSETLPPSREKWKNV